MAIDVSFPSCVRDENAYVREATAQAFMHLGSTAAPQLATLQSALGNEQQPEVGMALRNAIAEIQRQTPTPPSGRGGRGGQ